MVRSLGDAALNRAVGVCAGEAAPKVRAREWYKLLLPRDLKDSLTGDRAAKDAAVGRMDRAEKIGIGSGLGTILTGIGLVFLMGGFGAMPVRIHVGLSLVILMFVLGATVGRPAGERIRAAVKNDDGPTALHAARRLTVVFGIEQALWTITLVLMVLKI